MGEVNVDNCLEDVAIPRLCAIKAPCPPFLVCACVPRGLVDVSADPEQAQPINAAAAPPSKQLVGGEFSVRVARPRANLVLAWLIPRYGVGCGSRAVEACCRVEVEAGGLVYGDFLADDRLT